MLQLGVGIVYQRQVFSRLMLRISLECEKRFGDFSWIWLGYIGKLIGILSEPEIHNLLPILNFGAKEAPKKVGVGTVEKFVPKNMGWNFVCTWHKTRNTPGNFPHPHCNVRM